MKKQTGINPGLASAAENFLAANAPAPRLDGRPHKKAAVKKGRRSKATSRRAGGKKVSAKKVSPQKPRMRAKSNPTIPAVGGTIERTYKKEKIVVKVVEGGFRYASETFSSLSALAKKITGYPAISGPEFFRLTPKDKPEAK